jgi:serine/threonine protein kinase
MGVVYRGVSPAGEQLAVKQIRSHRFTPEERARFAAEIEALKTVFGPRIVSYVDGDASAEQPWLAVEYLAGATLRDYVGEHGPLEPLLVAILGAALAEGLATIHKMGLLHRDLKPHNIILTERGPVVIDFGLAVLTTAKVEAAESPSRLTAPGTVVGTLLCMPPEQVRAESLTSAADVYALGATLLYAATGHYPFAGDSDYALMQQIASPATTPDLTDLPPVLAPAITSMLAKDPADRPSLESVTGALVTVVTQAGFTATRARELLRRTTASNVARRPEPEPAADDDTPAAWPPRRPSWRVRVSTDYAPEAAVRAARRLRAEYARNSAL